MYSLSTIQNLPLPGLKGVGLSEAEIAKRFDLGLDAVENLNSATQAYFAFIDSVAPLLDAKHFPNVKMAAAGLSPDDPAIADVEELRSTLITNTGNSTYGSVLATCAMLTGGVADPTYTDVFLYYLRLRLGMVENPVIPEAMVLDAAAVHAVWANFSRLASQDQDFLLKHFYLFGLAIGVPVKWNIERVFSDYTEVIGFIDKYGGFIGALETNNEPVGEQSGALLFGKFFTDYHSFHKEKKTSTNEFISSTKIDLGVLKPLFSIALELAEKIKTATLVPYEEYEKAHATTLAEVFRKDLVTLFEWYLRDDEWQKIVSYFKDNHGPVPLGKFFAVCRQSFDLDQADAVGRLTRLSEFLRENGILKQNQDFITYNESDGKFYWNNEILY